MAKREVAVSYISTANDEISNGNYAQARTKAQDAFAKGNESYTDALARQKTLLSGFDLFGMIGGIGGIFKGMTMIIILVVVAVLVIVGVIIYRKRSRWDELG